VSRPEGGGSTPVVGVVSPGEMGSALGRVLAEGGCRVLATTAGRSERTRELARQAGLELVADLDELVRGSAVLLSVVPPGEAAAVAVDLAERAGRLGVRPVLVDLNAVAPEEVARTAQVAAAAGLDLVDGAVSGAPPRPGGPATRVLLSGPGAEAVAALPWTGVRVSVVGPEVGAASAVKTCTGSVRKGTSALVVNALLTAARHGVLEPVAAELRRALGSDPLVDAELAASKAWRFVPEMDAVAGTQEAAGLDPALFRAVADVFRRTSTSPLASRRPEDVARDPGADPGRAAAVAAGLAPAPRARGGGQRVGVGGLGRMGAPIAGHLAEAGYDVLGLDPADPAGLHPAVRRVGTGADLAGCAVVLVTVGGAAVADLLLDGGRLRPAWRDRDVVVCSTVDPA
jgi:3-hydroxyisobutyrate dehydrogenase-like beta-hydroxyacid dehydrogenase